jgi:hypothetical protein
MKNNSQLEKQMGKNKRQQPDDLFSQDHEGDEEVASDEAPSSSKPIRLIPEDNSGMDKRCPMMLKEYPTTFCPMAVIRLKAVKNLEYFPSEEEESKLPGCSYSINHQQSCYCWFKYARDYLTKDTPHHEIAHLLNIPEDEVYAIEANALEKVRKSAEVEELQKTHDHGGVFNGAGDLPYHELHVARKK